MPSPPDEFRTLADGPQDEPHPESPPTPRQDSADEAATAREDSDATRIPEDAVTAPLPTDDADVTPPTRNIPTHDAPTARPHSEVRSSANWDTVEASGEFTQGQVIFGRYIVQQKLGRGGMGAVWLVTHRELNVDRAIKLIVAGISFDAQTRARFRREAQVMAKFLHPNAVIVHDARLTENDVAYIDMEFIQGKSLDKILQRGRAMPLDWIAPVLDQLCDVLQVAHEKGIVHRDLKPANMMLLDDRMSGRDHLKVLDFGIAKILGEVETQGPQTMTGAFMGTPPYASPEQADGKADTRSDLYAVGIMLYEFLTGYRPFSGPAARILVDTITQPPPPFAKINPNVAIPHGIEALVLKCLSKNADDRPQTAREIAEEFRRHLPQPVRVEKGSVAPGSPSRIARNVAVGASLSTLALVVFLASRGRDPARTGGQGPDGNPTRPKIENPPLGPALPDGFAAAPKADRDKVGRPTRLVPTAAANLQGLVLVSIPGGEFEMGQAAARHKARVADFALGDAEVTNGQMRAYFQVRKITPPREFEAAYRKLLDLKDDEGRPVVTPEEADLHPAVGVPHAMAREFARWLKADLPTEEQWEYAARSRGLAGRPYPWSSPSPLTRSSGRANIDRLEDQGPPTSKARNYPDDQTEQGVYDLAGNVREMTRDVDETGKYVVRGASWKGLASEYPDTNFARDFIDGSEARDDVGFRICVNWPVPPKLSP